MTCLAVAWAGVCQNILAYEQKDPHGLNGFLLLLLHLGSQRQDKMHVLLEHLAARGYSFVRVDEMLS